MFKIGFLGLSAALFTAGCATTSAPAPTATPLPGRVAAPRGHLPFESLDDLFTNDPDPRRNEVVLVSMSQLGIPYSWGGTRPEVGFDCSGLVNYVFWQAIRVRAPRVTYDQARWARQVGGQEVLRPADLVFFNTLGRSFSHVGIFIGNDRFIHAPATGHAVRVELMSLDYWRTRFNGARRPIG